MAVRYSATIEDIELAVPNMSLPTPNCCIVVLNQQQEQNIEHHNQSSEAEVIDQCEHKSKNCTVIENGLVVVRPSQTPPQEVK
ncbi:MAG: hypothetical protein JOZ78_27515 [Chroococcidiopsidaceae cyanobacterium CP_BM_ER_R8_30]|nr:hypothetical protein [Chroococcidiopsidaceae cyanobacterium CP_BM_ER_R8_30]